MGFGLGVLDRPPGPSRPTLLFEPTAVAGARRRIRVGEGELNAVDGALRLPFRGILPRGLRVIAERNAGCAIDLVAHARRALDATGLIVDAYATATQVDSYALERLYHTCYIEF